MSIFKDTFKEEIQNQLKARQDAINQRTPNAIQYLNSRNAWIRMSSSVNVNGSNDLASKYILQGGVLFNGNLRSGVGISGAYSTASPGSSNHRLGIRLMPGITGINIKSKSAYGSLREVEVKFNAWDVKQLEELELLYMRPGYTVLVEWGWMPYLNNGGALQSNIDFSLNDIINKKPTKEQLFKNIYDTAVKTYKGNYDAMFGYIKNYSWSARADGGYDCSTTIISVGEIVESLKVNYAPFNNIDVIVNGKGLLKDSKASKKDLKDNYSANILAGLFYETWLIGSGKEDEEPFTITDKKSNSNYYAFRKKINISGGDADSSNVGEVGTSDVQVYITLESLCNLINNFVTFTDSNSKEAYVKCSVFEREYDKNAPNNPDVSTGEGGYLLGLAHPLQISMDPTVCLINASIWNSGTLPSIDTVEELNPTPDTNVVQYTNTDSKVYDDLIKEIIRLSDINDVGSKTENELIEKLSTTLKSDANEIKQLSKIWSETNPTKQGISLASYLAKKLSTNEINKAIGEGNIEFTRKNPAIVEKEKLEKQKKETKKIQNKAVSEAQSNLSYLSKLNPYFYKKDYSTEMSIIGNIYVNVNYLYRLVVNDNLEAKDTKEKNDINLYDFLKQVLSEVSSAIGSVNNFDIYVDPIDSIIRLIDINYVDNMDRKDAFDKAFTLEMQNTKSTVRSYKLESQIFPDQSATIAIGAQVGGGAMATDNNTMLDFNKGLEDRIIPKKDDPLTDSNIPTSDTITNQLANLSSIFDIFYGFFNRLDDTTILFVIKIEDADFNTEKAGQYKNALKDLINFYKNLTKSDIKNRSIIPTKLSVTMDGIGGLVIGHIFKIPEELLPKGYKGGENGVGSKLGHIVTGIGHSVQNNDWTTNIDAQTIILDSPTGGDLTFTNIVKKDETYKEEVEERKEQVISNATKKYTANLTTTVKRNLDYIEQACIKGGITNRFMIIAIKANILKETGGIPKNEDLAGYANTSNSRIRTIFASRVASLTEDQLLTIKKNTSEFSEYIYGLRSGKTGKSLGNNKAGDGYKYRGRSFIGITGKAQYQDYSTALKKDFINNPDSMNTPENAADTTVLYLNRNLPSMSRRLKIDYKNPQSQAEANQLVTSTIAGQALQRPPKAGSIWVEIFNKVDSYSNQLT
jgi:predicted chitinase